MKILITGYKGFIGSYLYDALKPHHEVIGLDIKDGLKGDAFYAPRVEGVDVVYHLAAQTEVVGSAQNLNLDVQANILLTIRLLNLYPAARFIYTGSGGASEQGTIASAYGLSKKVAGDYVKLLHPNHVTCNLPNVYGKGGKGVIETFLQCPEVITIYGDGEQTRDFVHVLDVVRGLISAMNWPVGVYDMGSGSSVSIRELAMMFPAKYVVNARARHEELRESVLTNTTPDWRPTMTIDYYLTESFANDYCAKHGTSIAGKRCRWCIDDRVDTLRRDENADLDNHSRLLSSA